MEITNKNEWLKKAKENKIKNGIFSRYIYTDLESLEEIYLVLESTND